MKTLADLQAIKENLQSQMDLRNESHADTKIAVGLATCGIAAGARSFVTAFSDSVQEPKLHGVSVTLMGCIGLCSQEPIAEITTPKDGKVIYVKMTPEKAKRVVEEHIIGGNVVKEYTIDNNK